MNSYLTPGISEWRDSPYICALGGADRHYGHVVKLNRWHAYDATKLNEASDGFLYLGGFDDLIDAKREVERSVAQGRRRPALRAVAMASTVWGT